ncbi:MAG: SDR family NAD(P)-dependent oxidoreductase [Tepidiformaceae bacterium]
MGALDGKVAIITGAGSGIGKRAAIRFADQGARVVVADVSVETAQTTAEEIGRSVAKGEHVDVRDEESVARLVEAAVTHFGRIDVAFNVAGIPGRGTIDDLAMETWGNVLAVHLTGTFLCTKYEGAQLKRQGSPGSIVNMASLNALQAAEGLAAYCTAKAGIAMFSKVAALEGGPHGIRVNAVAPGLISTPRTQQRFASNSAVEGAYLSATPLGRLGEIDDVANLALFLASDASDWITGQVLSVDGGATLKKYPEITRPPISMG